LLYIFPRNLPKRYAEIKILYLSKNNQSQLFNIYVIHTLVFYETEKCFWKPQQMRQVEGQKLILKLLKRTCPFKLNVCSVNTVHTR